MTAGKGANDPLGYRPPLAVAGSRYLSCLCPSRLEAFSPNEVVTTVISMEEQMRDWLALIHRVPEAEQHVAYYEQLLGLVAFFAEWEMLPFDQRAAVTFERLRQQRVRIGTMDLKIAAIALGHNALVLSGNLRDFQQGPDLNVEDWR
jgi:tRNA(fMet)-specific endonuclease VapC